MAKAKPHVDDAPARPPAIRPGPAFPPAGIGLGALAAKAWRRFAFGARRVMLGVVANRVEAPSRAEIAALNGPFFAAIGIGRAAAEGEHRSTCARMGRTVPADESLHFLAFAALRAAGFRPSRILELGTATGETTNYLAALFPEATLHTIDLPWDDPIFVRYHGRAADERAARIEFRGANIRPIRINTAFLGTLDLPDFDLIWLDAGHEFPEVAWDHFYCLGKLRPGGWLFSDDLRFPDNRLHRRAEAHHAALVTEYFNARQATKFRYLLKREDPRLYFLDRKYIGYLHKPGDCA